MENETKRCVECGGTMHLSTIERKFNYQGKELTIKGINAYVCDKCGEEVFTSEEAHMIERVLKAFIDRNDNSILNLSETAELLRVSNQTIYNMIKDGRIKAYKAGREWRFLQSDIITYMNNSMSDSNLLAAKGGRISAKDMEIINKELEKRKSNA